MTEVTLEEGGGSLSENSEWKRVKNALCARIESGEYAENNRLLPERELCDEFHVSRTTIRQALLELENSGYILRQQGRGTYVRPRLIEQQLSSVYSFAEELRKQNISPGTRMLSLNTILAQKPVEDKLMVQPGTLLRMVCRLRLANDTPYVYETSYLPAEYLGSASSEEISVNGLYNTLYKHSGIRIDKATETFEAILAPNYVVEALGRKGVLCVMQLDRVAYSDGRPVEYCSAYVCGDKYRFHVTLHT